MQEAVVDQTEDFVLVRAIAAAGYGSEKPSQACTQAVGPLQGILSVLSEPGLNAQISLGQVLLLASKKQRLKGARVAKGLQCIIDNTGGL